MKYSFLNQINEDIKTDIFLNNLELNNTHPQDVHLNVSDVDLLDRTLNDNISSTGFKDLNNYKNCLVAAINDKQDEIQKFIIDNNNITNEIAFDVVLSGDDYQNKGFKLFKNRSIKEVSINVYKLVLEKNDKTPYGFNLKTFYPNADLDYIDVKNPEDINAKYMNTNLEEKIKKTQFYKSGNIMDKIYAQTLVNPNFKSYIRLNKESKSKSVTLYDIRNQNLKIDIGSDYRRFLDNKNKILDNSEEILKYAIKSPTLIENTKKLINSRDALINQILKERKSKLNTIIPTQENSKDRGLEK